MEKEETKIFSLGNHTGIVTNCEMITKVEVGRDHRLVRNTLRMNTRLARLRTIKIKKIVNNNTPNLTGMKDRCEINLKKIDLKKNNRGGGHIQYH